MPLNNHDIAAISAFQPTDLLYGLDTDALKYRTYFRKKYYPQDTDEQHKIDFYTKTMGPKVDSPLPNDWTKNPLAPKWSRVPAEFQGLKQDFRDALQGQGNFPARYDPARAANADEWNARFRRTSKAGLQWGLLVKGWNVHFLVPGIEFRDVVSKPTRGPDDAQLPPGSSAGPKGKRRITYCEMRWVYRHRKFPEVHERVQFWNVTQPNTMEFEPIVAPWITEPQLWQQYKSKCEHVLEDYALTGRPPPQDRDDWI